MIGAVECCLEFEEVRANRDIVNSTNRMLNMDTANMKRIYETGSRQKEEILLIDERLGIKNIKSEKTRELCLLRLENESASLNDLANLLSEKFNKTITKSNVNHMFRYLHELYLRLSNGQ